MLLFAGALAVLALGALPAVASAETPSIDPETGTFPLTFSGTTGTATITTRLGTGTISAIHIHGEFESATTGWVEFTYTDFTFGGGLTSTVPAAPAGTVTTTQLPFHLIMIDSTGQLSGGKPGLLITPNEGQFSTFHCPFFGTVMLAGNGTIGEISKPTCANGVFTKTSTIKFESTGTGVQKYKQVEPMGTSFSWFLKSGLGGTLEFSEDAEDTIEFARNTKLTC